MSCPKLSYDQPQGFEDCSIFSGKTLDKKRQSSKIRLEYHPFGTTSYRAGRNVTETSLKRYRYVGKERDEETGLYYYGARYYAPWIARFVSTDPLKDEYPYYTSYQYAGNQPITFIDLDGLEPATPPLNQLDNPSAISANQRIADKRIFIDNEFKAKKLLRENAKKIIETVKGEGSSATDGKPAKKNDDFKLIKDNLKGHAKGKIEGLIEKSIDNEIIGEKNQLRESGTLTTNKGRNFQTSRFKTTNGIKEPVNFGLTDSNGQVETTKGTITTSPKLNRLNKLKGGLKLFKNVKSGPLGIIASGLDLARVSAGQAEPGSILPLSFIAEDQFKEIDRELLETSINQGLESTENFISGSDELELIFVGEADALKLLSKDANSLEQLEGFEEATLKDKNNQFGLLISRTRKDVSVHAIFHDEKGFNKK